MNFLQVTKFQIVKSKTIYLCFVFYLSFFHLKAQDFNEILNLPGDNLNFKVRILQDSTYVSLSPAFYPSATGNNDSFVVVVARHNKRGEMMYYASIPSPSGYFFNPMDLIVVKGKFFIGGYIEGKGDTGRAFLMRLNQCFDLEKYIIYSSKIPTSTGIPHFSIIQKFSDSEILANGPYFIDPKDTMFNTLFLMDTDFNIKWHTSNIGFLNDIAITHKNIHLWGMGYYRLSSNMHIRQSKFHQTILDFKGNTLSQTVRGEYMDDTFGGGGNIIATSSNNFLIGTEFRNSIGDSYNLVDKIDNNGRILKSRQLNVATKKEAAAGICRVNDNRFIEIGTEMIDNENTKCTAYLIDSNLNIIRKKSILPGLAWVELFPLGLSDGALLYGDINTSNEQKGILYKIDTFLNVVLKPSILNYHDSICPVPEPDHTIFLKTNDTVWLEDLKLRENMRLTSSVSALAKSSDISIFPNPNKGNFKVGFEAMESGQLLIYDMVGKLLLSQPFTDKNEIEIKLSGIASGLIIVNVKTSHFDCIEKIIVEL